MRNGIDDKILEEFEAVKYERDMLLNPLIRVKNKMSEGVCKTQSPVQLK
jgi:hypothetical protein